MAASVTGFFASVINIAQIRPSVWAQPEIRQLARSSHVPHGAFGCNSVAEVFVARFDERRYSKIAVGKTLACRISAGDLQEVRYAR